MDGEASVDSAAVQIQADFSLGGLGEASKTPLRSNSHGRVTRCRGLAARWRVVVGTPMSEGSNQFLNCWTLDIVMGQLWVYILESVPPA